MHALESELSGTKDLQRQLLEHLFKGLRYFLDDFSEHIPKGTAYIPLTGSCRTLTHTVVWLDARKPSERLDFLLAAVKVSPFMA
jgi:hypothetical protein